MKFAPSVITAALIAASSLVGAVPIDTQEIAGKSAEGLSLLRFGPNAIPVWKTKEEKWALKRAGTNFMDVTETWVDMQSNPAFEKVLDSRKEESATATFSPPSHQSAVNALIASLSLDNMQSNLDSLTAFNNRYYTSTTGQQSAQWIFDTLTAIADGQPGVTVTEFAHSWVQFSVIARIDGSTSGPVTILGCHQDSINLKSPEDGSAPGADDDGSGAVNAIEIFRVLVTSGFKPTTPLEIHFYSGEESGLLGSQAVASNYSKAGTPVKAFMELDMTAYFKPGTTEVIAVEADYVDSETNAFAKSLISTYSELPAADDSPCGYACSDHASWYQYGYPTTMLYEAITGNDNPNVHTPDDTTSVDGFSWSHSLEFAKVALAFLYELSA